MGKNTPINSSLFAHEQKKRKSNSNKRAIKLDGTTWLKYSLSIWNDIRKSKTEEKLKHPAIFPASLAKRLMEVFTFEEDIVLDPFVGTGSTILAFEGVA